MKHLRLLLLLALGLAFVASSHAQIVIGVSIKDRFHLLHEPLVTTATITNQTGRDITFSDTQQYQWFAFRITQDGERSVSPRDLHYQIPPLTVKANETVKRSVDLHQLYDISSIGTYRIQANVYYTGFDKFFASKPIHIEINEGHVLWRQIAGVPEGQPDGGQMHVFTLLSHQVGEANTLYVRVEDKEDGRIFCTLPLGRLIDNVPPQAAFDAMSNLYILQLVGTRTYTLNKITVNGRFGGQTVYSAPKSRPMLRKTAAGGLEIIGGHRESELAQNPNAEPAPKLSDRPLGLPGN